MFKNKSFLLIVAILGSIIYTYFNQVKNNTFQYDYLDRNANSINSDSFLRDKNNLINQANKPNKTKDKYVLSYRNLMQGYRCKPILNLSNPTNKSLNKIELINIKEYMFSSFDKNGYAKIQKDTFMQYVNECLSLLDKNEDYAQMIIRFKDGLEASVANTKNGLDLQVTYDLNQSISTQIMAIRKQVGELEKQLKQENNKNIRRILMHKITDTKGEIWKLRNNNREKYDAILTSTKSPDAILSILYNYKNTLPHSWYLGILYKLTGINDRFINSYIENEYIDNLIYPSIDLYVCALGYPCDENSYRMYFQCLGIKYKANANACNKKVVEYDLSSFLNENMQVDALKIIEYFKEYGHE